MSLRNSAFSAGRWAALSIVLRTGLQVLQTVVLARLLVPSDFGLMAIASAVYAIVILFVDLGLSSALIHFPHPSRTVLSTLYWLNLGAAFLLMVLLMLLSWPVSHFYRQPEIVPVMMLMSLAMPLGASGLQFRVMAERELRFAIIAGIDIASMAVAFAAAILAASLGGGVYALVAGLLSGAIASSALFWLLLSEGLRPAFCFDLKEVRPWIRYGSYRLGDTLFNCLQHQADVLIGGSVLGAAAMGMYTVPRDQALKVANTIVNPVVTRVGLPVMARLQDDKAALKSVYLQTLRVTSSINFPIYAAIAIWSNEIVAILLGEKWWQAADFLRLFALWGLIRSTGNPVGSLVYATGRVRAAFWWNLAQLAVVPFLLWWGVRADGAHGLALAMLGAQFLFFYPQYYLMVRPSCGAGFVEYLGALAPALMSTVLALGVGLIVSSLLLHQAWLGIVGAGLAYGAAYLVASLFLNKPWLDAMGELMAPVLKRLR